MKHDKSYELPKVPLNDNLSASLAGFEKVKLDVNSDTLTCANNTGNSSIVSLIFNFGKEFFRSGETVFTKICLGSFCDNVCACGVFSNFGITFGRSVTLICFVNGKVKGFSILT